MPGKMHHYCFRAGRCARLKLFSGALILSIIAAFLFFSGRSVLSKMLILAVISASAGFAADKSIIAGISRILLLLSAWPWIILWPALQLDGSSRHFFVALALIFPLIPPYTRWFKHLHKPKNRLTLSVMRGTYILLWVTISIILINARHSDRDLNRSDFFTDSVASSAREY